MMMRPANGSSSSDRQHHPSSQQSSSSLRSAPYSSPPTDIATAPSALGNEEEADGNIEFQIFQCGKCRTIVGDTGAHELYDEQLQALTLSGELRSVSTCFKSRQTDTSTSSRSVCLILFRDHHFCISFPHQNRCLQR